MYRSGIRVLAMVPHAIMVVVAVGRDALVVDHRVTTETAKLGKEGQPVTGENDEHSSFRSYCGCDGVRQCGLGID